MIIKHRFGINTFVYVFKHSISFHLKIRIGHDLKQPDVITANNKAFIFYDFILLHLWTIYRPIVVPAFMVVYCIYNFSWHQKIKLNFERSRASFIRKGFLKLVCLMPRLIAVWNASIVMTMMIMMMVINFIKNLFKACLKGAKFSIICSLWNLTRHIWRVEPVEALRTKNNSFLLLQGT